MTLDSRAGFDSDISKQADKLYDQGNKDALARLRQALVKIHDDEHGGGSLPNASDFREGGIGFKPGTVEGYAYVTINTFHIPHVQALAESALSLETEASAKDPNDPVFNMRIPRTNDPNQDILIFKPAAYKTPNKTILYKISTFQLAKKSKKW